MIAVFSALMPRSSVFLSTCYGERIAAGRPCPPGRHRMAPNRRRPRGGPGEGFYNYLGEQLKQGHADSATPPRNALQSSSRPWLSKAP